MTRSEYNTAVDLYADGLYRFIMKSMNDSEAAKDVLQDVFTKLWVKHKDVQYEKVKSYVFTAGYRTMLNAIRNRKKEADLTEVVESRHGHEKQYSDLGEILEEAVGKLPDIQRNMILLRDYEGYSYKEIGEILDLNEPQVKVYIFRARKFLQQYLKSVESLI